MCSAKPALKTLAIRDCRLDAAMLQNLGTRWPQIRGVIMRNSGFDPASFAAIKHAKWDHLHLLMLDFNLLGTTGVQHLVSCSCPSLQT